MKHRELGERVTSRGLLVVAGCLGLVSVAVACGGKVTFVEDGPTNDGGAGSTGTKMSTSSTMSTTKATTGTVMTSPASSGTGSTLTACEKLCANPGCAGGGCMQGCQAIYEEGCELQADQLITCAAENVDANCELNGGACANFAEQYEQCTNQGSCTNQGCEGGMGFCDCVGDCFGDTVQAVCKQSPMGFQCQCLMNGTQVGSCFGGGPGQACDIESGCCAQFWLPLPG